MDYNSFLDWLTTEKGMGSRGAHDVVSRCKRIQKLAVKNDISDVTSDMLLECEAFQGCSMFIKSQLKRAAVLSQEYLSMQGDRYK